MSSSLRALMASAAVALAALVAPTAVLAQGVETGEMVASVNFSPPMALVPQQLTSTWSGLVNGLAGTCNGSLGFDAIGTSLVPEDDAEGVGTLVAGSLGGVYVRVGPVVTAALSGVLSTNACAGPGVLSLPASLLLFNQNPPAAVTSSSVTGAAVFVTV